MEEKRFKTGVLVGGVSVALLMTVFLVVILVVYTPTLNYGYATNGSKEQSYEQNKNKGEKALTESLSNVQDKLGTLESLIDVYYLNEINAEDLEDGIYKGVMNGLGDPYSVYYTKEEYQAMEESTSGIYCGIGVYISQDVQTMRITVVKPFRSGASYEAGILPGDVIIAVEGESIEGEDINAVVAKIKGEEHTYVTITIQRDGEEMDFTLERRMIEVDTIEYEILENQIGYILVTEFDKVTAAQFKEAIAALKQQGMERLIIDLRDNPGGLLDVAVDMVDQFVTEGFIVYTQDKYGNKEELSATDTQIFDRPIAVLVNGNSASAAEIFAGAMQDAGAATIVGEVTFGKGIVQNLIPLEDGTAVKITVAEYFTASGKKIHGVGIIPDVEVALDEKLEKQTDVLFEEDNQLQKAIEIIQEK